MHDTTSWKEHSGTWVASPDGHAVRGMGGMLFSRNTAPADFSVAMQLRYDELRFFARTPFSGIAFHVADSKNWDAIVLTNDECQLSWKQVRNGKETIVAKSNDGFYTEVGQPFWMKVSVTKGELEGALSLNGKDWKVLLHQKISGIDAAGRLGLIAGAPEMWFSWGDDAKFALPAYRPYSYATLRQPPANLKHPPVRADYLKTLQELQRIPLAADDSLQEQGLSSVRAWQASKDDAWKKRAILSAKKMIAQYHGSGTAPIGFASFYQEMVTLKTAMDNNWLTAEERADVPRIAATALLRGQYERGPMNRALGNLVGIRPALELAPDFAQRSQVEEIVRRVEQDFADYGYSPVEDASDYIKVSLQFVAIHALESRPDWWKQKDLHDVFFNFATSISPLGRFPGFGDDDDADAPELVGLLELASAKWGDPVFQEATRRLWAVSYGRSLPVSVKSSEITGIALAATYAPETAPAIVAPAQPLEVLYRANGEPAKVILQNGSTWMMVDLFAGGEHGHNDSLAVTTMENNGTVQLEDNGRYARGMMFHNRPQFTEHAIDFPLSHALTEQTRRIRQQYFTNGEWTFYHLPLHDHWIWGNFAGDAGLPTLQRDAYNPEIPATLNYDPKKQTIFILDLRGTGKGRISLSDPHITGPDGRRDLPLTIPAGAPAAQIQPHTRDGKDVYIWQTPLSGANLFLGGVAPGATNIAAAHNEWLDFWLKIEPIGDSRVEINSFALGDRDGYPKRWLDALSPNGEVTLDEMDTVDGGAQMVASEKMISQQDEPILFTRDIFLALPGIAWVRDTMRNEGTHSGTVGVLWYGVKPVQSDLQNFHFSTGLQLTMTGAKKTGVDNQQSYGMRNQGIAYGGLDLAGHSTAVVDSMLIADTSRWHSVAVQGDAAVWSDGTYWVGRNPAGIALHFDGLQTDHKLFVLTRKASH
ncbi:MAG TPA: hypothetical protein VGB94_12035 [Acidobacteriaceae bacterium]